MWRTVLGSSVVLYFIVVCVSTAPAFNHNHYQARGPAYTISNHPERHRKMAEPHTNEGQKPYLEVKNATYHGIGPREEARAMCSVKTQEVNATANATITRRLHGVVSSREFHNSIQRLEVILFGQMQQLWQSLDALRAQLAGEQRTNFPDRRTMSFRLN